MASETGLARIGNLNQAVQDIGRFLENSDRMKLDPSGSHHCFILEDESAKAARRISTLLMQESGSNIAIKRAPDLIPA